LLLLLLLRSPMVRVVLPYYLRLLAKVDGEVPLEINGPVTLGALLDAVETRFPMLRGTIRDHVTHQRRAFLRYFACQDDLSLEKSDAILPAKIASGEEPFLIIAGIAGG